MDAVLAVAGFVTVAAITPGPNNFIVMGAAARGGFAGALPAIAGVVAGTLALLALVWAGAGAAFEAVPRLQVAMKLAGCLYLVWLGAVLVRRSGRHEDGRATPARQLPCTTSGLAVFQLLNPKGWVLVLTATAALSGDTASASLAVLAAVVTAVTGLCLTLWALAGSAIAGWLSKPRRRAWFDCSMGALLIGSAMLLLV